MAQPTITVHIKIMMILMKRLTETILVDVLAEVELMNWRISCKFFIDGLLNNGLVRRNIPFPVFSGINTSA